MDLRTLDRLAAPHAGVVSRAELLVAGWSEGQIARAARTGALIRVCHGVYRVAGARWSRSAAHHAALLAAGEEAHLARWSAAALHDFVEPRNGPVDVLLPHPRSYTGGEDRLLRVQRTRSLPEADRDQRLGLPVTAPARTLLDLAATTSTARLGEHVAAALRVEACDASDLREVMDRRGNARGRGRLSDVLRLLGEDGGGARADVEVAALHHLVAAGLPRPVVAFRVFDAHGRCIAEVDLAYPDRHLAIEIDGYRWHSSPARKRADEERQNRLVLVGWTVLRFSASEVRAHPDRLVATVTSALGGAPASLTPGGSSPAS